MWEWSKPTTAPQAENSSLFHQYADLLPQPAQPLPPQTIYSIEYPEEAPDPQQMEDLIHKALVNFGLHHFELRACAYHPKTWADMSKNYIEYKRLRKTFLKFLGYSRSEECLRYGLDEEDLKLLKNQQSPENYNTHIKIPFDFGGTISLDNLCLLKTHPVHDQIHHLIEMQIGCNFLKKHKIIYIPWFDGSFYHE